MNFDISKYREDAELVANRIMTDYGAVMRWVVKYPKWAAAGSFVLGGGTVLLVQAVIQVLGRL